MTASELVLAVDGGNVKTDLALLGADGALLALVRGGRSSPHYIGVDGCIDLLESLLAEALASAGMAPDGPLQAAAAQILVAGADLPEELSALREQIEKRRWAQRLGVDNDTFALLRSGTDRGWGVAVVCGGGINCVGLGPDGRQVRYPSLGTITGDWGGGYAVGLAAQFAAARSADGRGPHTVLETEVPAYFGFATPFEVARAVHLKEMSNERLGELARVVFASAPTDEVAAGIVNRLADEVIGFATATLRRLELTEAEVDVVLGGGLLRASPAATIERIASGIHAVAPHAQVLVAPSAPIVGAALLALDELAVDRTVADRARRELGAAFTQIEGDGTRVQNGHRWGASRPLLERQADG
jgi:N-acetylglucosamine kinase-like BadF-type ATPase